LYGELHITCGVQLAELDDAARRNGGHDAESDELRDEKTHDQSDVYRAETEPSPTSVENVGHETVNQA
jgi:hypothetical protein